jgi:hypothetical protein
LPFQLHDLPVAEGLAKGWESLEQVSDLRHGRRLNAA